MGECFAICDGFHESRNLNQNIINLRKPFFTCSISSSSNTAIIQSRTGHAVSATQPESSPISTETSWLTLFPAFLPLGVEHTNCLRWINPSARIAQQFLLFSIHLASRAMREYSSSFVVSWLSLE